MTAIAMLDYGSLPAVQISAPDGATAIVTLFGAHLMSWKTADGQERLFCSAKSALDGSRAIRGGVPVIFPQFAERGTGLRHGFARVSNWRLEQSGLDGDSAFASFALTGSDLSAAHAQAWPHGFRLALRIALRAGTLELRLAVTNTGSDGFAFSSALHSYFAVRELSRIRIAGVQQGELGIEDKLDQIYRGIGGPIVLTEDATMLRLEQSGFSDAVVWNPGAADAAALADMDDEEYRRFVCIEPALIAPLTLAPGAAWQGEHRIAASSIP